MGNHRSITDQSPPGVVVRDAVMGDAVDIVWKLSRRKIDDFKRFYDDLGGGIRELMTNSIECLCITYEGRPAALFGIYDSTGLMWTAVTRITEENPIKCIKTSRLILDDFNQRYPILTSSIPDDDPVWKRWIELIGCQVFHEREGRISFMKVAD